MPSTEEFYFKGTIQGSFSVAPAPNLTGERELTFWNSIKDENDARLFEEYLKRYPDGEFVSIAKAKLDRLRSTVVSVPPQPPQGAANNTSPGKEVPMRSGPQRRWVGTPFDSARFAPALKEVIRAARSNFQPIKGDLNPNSDGEAWEATVTLPGVPTNETCSVWIPRDIPAYYTCDMGHIFTPKRTPRGASAAGRTSDPDDLEKTLQEKYAQLSSDVEQTLGAGWQKSSRSGSTRVAETVFSSNTCNCDVSVGTTKSSLKIEVRLHDQPPARPGGAINEPAAPASSTAVPDGMLNRLYVANRLSDIYRNSINHDYLMFFPDGSVMHGLPDQGFDGFNFQTWASTADQALVGRYRAYGNRIEIVWNAANQRGSVERDENADDTRGNQVYIPVCRCSGAKFSGVYMWGPYSIQFSPDGRFVDRGVADQFHFFPDSVQFFEHPRSGGGTYAVQNYTLYLDYGAGRRVRATFGAPAVQENAPQFNWISIGYNTLYRQDYRPAP